MACTECHGTGSTMFGEPCPHLMARRPGLRARVRARIARWAYRTGRFDLAMRLSPETYWNEAHRAAEHVRAEVVDSLRVFDHMSGGVLSKMLQASATRRARELRGDD